MSDSNVPHLPPPKKKKNTTVEFSIRTCRKFYLKKKKETKKEEKKNTKLHDCRRLIENFLIQKSSSQNECKIYSTAKV